MSILCVVSCVGDKPVMFNQFPLESNQGGPPLNVNQNTKLGVVSAAIDAQRHVLSRWHVANPDDENFVICQYGMFTLLFQN